MFLPKFVFIIYFSFCIIILFLLKILVGLFRLTFSLFLFFAASKFLYRDYKWNLSDRKLCCLLGKPLLHLCSGSPLSSLLSLPFYLLPLILYRTSSLFLEDIQLTFYKLQKAGSPIIRKNSIYGMSAGLTTFECSSDTLVEDNQFFNNAYSGMKRRGRRRREGRGRKGKRR